MSLINPAILYGLGLAAIPVILHFLLRSRPRKLLFPALRLIQIRRKNNVRRLRLRHIWLLLLRIAVIGVLVAALARPSLPAANYGLNTRETVTLLVVAAVLLAAYYALLWRWRRNRVPNHVYTYRRTLLRGGTGLAAAVLLLLLVAWPYTGRVLAEIDAPDAAVAENLPVAAVFLFDTSGSMSYTQENRTRLEAAREIATRHIASLPVQSRVAVAGSGSAADIVFQADLVGARDRIEALEIEGLSRGTLNDLLRAAVSRQLVDRRETLALQSSLPEEKRRDRFLREIYIFTDLTRGAWDQTASTRLREELARFNWLRVYLIDVGVREPINAAVTDLRLSRQTVPRGGEVRIEATLSVVGLQHVERVVKLNVIDPAGRRSNKGQATVIFGDTPVNVPFVLQGLVDPFVQAEVAIDETDPLPFDDRRFFTIAVLPPPRVLVAADSRSDANIWMQALAPSLLPPGQAPYQVDYVHAVSLEQTDLSGYEVLCLVNVGRPREAVWKKLEDYVAAGGGLAVILGMPSREGEIKLAYDAEPAQSILPAELLRDLELVPPEVLDLQQLSHPILRKFDEYGNTGTLTSQPVRRYWRVRPLPGAAVIARYSDPRRSPAILERAHGRGRVIMLTSGVSRGGWNDWPLSGWPFVVLADQTMQYLAGRAAQNFNFEAGDTVRLRLTPTPGRGGVPDAARIRDAVSVLRKPNAQVPLRLADEGERQPRDDAATITIAREQTDQVGNYRVRGDGAESRTRSAFSLNAPAQESNLSRISTTALDELLGPGRYQIATGTETLDRLVTRGRIGQEVFPLVLAVLLCVFCGEMLVANRFYQADQGADWD